ncbi:MAG: TrkA family potassium uptake protein [Clostridiales bacterium]|nr:TrkA family potassium uptake protein [Clostridiales bacterium]MCF8021869.1 TrkA family potassium uptake protein [Clostridiales bacterium]
MKNKQFAVIGLGRFGMSMIKELSNLGYEVLAIDRDEDKINDATDIATHAVIADILDEHALKSLGIKNFDVAIISIGENIQNNILTTILLKEMGVAKIVSKARNALHGKVLEKIGTDLVIYPERDMAKKLARSLVSKNILEQIDLSTDYSIMELVAPKNFVNKKLLDLDMREKLKVTILAIRRNDDIIIAPQPQKIILKDDVLVVIGKNDHLVKLSEMDL